MLSLYYLGKFHDSTKDVVQLKGQIIEYIGKIEAVSVKNQQKEILEKSSDLLKLGKEAPSEQNDISRDIMKLILKAVIGVALFYVLAIVFYFKDLDQPTLNSLLGSLVGMLGGISLFMILWHQYEHFLNTIINFQEKGNELLAELKILLYRLERI